MEWSGVEIDMFMSVERDVACGALGASSSRGRRRIESSSIDRSIDSTNQCVLWRGIVVHERDPSAVPVVEVHSLNDSFESFGSFRRRPIERERERERERDREREASDAER